MSRYIQQKFLGSGTFSTVFLGLDTRTNTNVALKRIALNPSEGVPATTLREISILSSLDHINILKHLDTVVACNSIIIVFEYVEYPLKAYLSGNPPKLLIKQLADGVSYIHSKNIIHRDLKPENLLVTSNGILKIADFNLARSTGLIKRRFISEVVTLWYRAPELLRGATDYGPNVDMWSVGCILAEMLGSEPLFQGRDPVSQLETIRKVRDMRKFLVEKIGDSDFVDIIAGCLNFDQEKRYTANELREALKIIIQRVK